MAVERCRENGDFVYAGIIRHSDRKSPVEISDELRDLSKREKADDPRLKLFMRPVRYARVFLARWIAGLPPLGQRLWFEDSGGSFALNAVSKYGVDSVRVKWPRPLSFTFGEVRPQALMIDAAVVAQPSFYLTMGWHRIMCNGAPATRLFDGVVHILDRAEVEMASGNPGEGDRTFPEATLIEDYPRGSP